MAIDIIKLIVITVYLILSSKAIGETLNKKWKNPFKNVLGLGYFANLAIFLVLTLPVTIFKLSTFYLTALGSIYLAVCFVLIFFRIKDRSLFKFAKKDILVISLSLALLILYAFTISFGLIETYDSYFYNSLTNNAANSEAISVVDPYTGLSNLQNFYKYMSYYYFASFFAIISQISHPHLVLIWSFTMMNFILIFDTAFSACRISNYKIVNNILSIFYLTFILSIIRAPFNALYLTTFVVSIYVFRLSFQLFKGKNDSLYYLIICIIASVSFTSTSLFTLLPYIFILFVTNAFIKDSIDYKKLWILAIPVILLGSLYLSESIGNKFVLLFVVAFALLIYFLFTYGWFNKLVSKICKLSTVFVVTLLIFAKPLQVDVFINQYFLKSTAIKESEVVNSGSNEKICLGNNNIEILNHDSSYDFHEGLGSSINYMVGSGDTLLNKLLIYTTHSLFKYGGMIFLLLFGIFNKRGKYNFVSYVFYLIMFNNPLVSNGLDLITMGLSSRIILFFNTYYALLGMKYFFEFIIDKFKEKKYKLDINKILNLSYKIYGVLVTISIVTFSMQLMPDSFADFDFLFKTDRKIVELEEQINNIDFEISERKSRFFFTQSAFNVTMLDRNGENKSIVMNSKEFMNYFFNRNTITDKTMINDYFESEGKYYLSNIINVCNSFDFEKESPAECNCTIESLLKLYQIDYVVTKKPSDNEFYNLIQNTYDILFENSDYVILQTKGAENNG